MTKRPKEGTAHHIDPPGQRRFESAPRVGQSAKPYTTGSNAYGKHQRPTRAPQPGAKGVARSDGPFRRGSGSEDY